MYKGCIFAISFFSFSTFSFIRNEFCLYPSLPMCIMTAQVAAMIEVGLEPSSDTEGRIPPSHLVVY